MTDEEIRSTEIKKHFPNTFFYHDEEGRPLWILKVGSVHWDTLLSAVTIAQFTAYLSFELESAWRERMDKLKSDQINLLIDL